jgi:transaldolase
MPPATYEAFREAGKVAQTLEQDVDAAQAQIAALAGIGVDLKAVTDKLEADGVMIFVKAFDNLLHHLESKAAKLAA